jgi:hypothetical protein
MFIQFVSKCIDVSPALRERMETRITGRRLEIFQSTG